MTVTTKVTDVPNNFIYRDFCSTYDSQTGATSIDVNSSGTFSLIGDHHFRTFDTDWKVKIAKGQDAANLYEFKGTVAWKPFRLTGNSRWIVSNPPLHFYRSYGSFIDLSNQWGNVSYPSTDSVVNDIAVKRLKQRLNQDLQSFKAMAPLAELHEMRETFHFVTKSATNLVKALIDIRKTRGQSAAKYASEAWLQWSFGISPTLRDIESASAAIANHLARRDHSVRVVGSASKDWISGLQQKSITAFRGAPRAVDVHASHHLQYRWIAGFEFKISSANNYGMLDQLGLTFGDIVPAMWELTPFSWVVDYFTTVGDYLDDTFTSPPGSSIYVVQDRFYTCDTTEHPYFYSAGAQSINTTSCQPGSLKYVEFARTPQLTLPRRQLRIKTVDEVGKFAVTKLLNLASVLIQGSRPPRG